MSKSILTIIAIFGISFNVIAGNSEINTTQKQKNFRFPAGVSEQNYVPGKIILKVKTEYRQFCTNTGFDESRFRSISTQASIINMSKIFPGKTAPAVERNNMDLKLADLSLIYKADFSTDLRIEKVIDLLMATGLFEYVEPSYISSVSYTPNDPLLSNSGMYFLNKINAYNAWDINKGDTNIVVGIVDTGTDWDHGDLVTAIKYNYADPINGIDDDNDGFIDNYRGWDVAANDNDPMVTGSGVPAHGSHVSGCAAAATDNGVGVAGSGFKTKFLPVKISDNLGNLIAAYEGIVYAADHGCHIINCSWGGPGGGQFGQDIIDYATINQDRLVVAAAGNDGNEIHFFPSAYKFVLSVASTNDTDTKSGFSNYGTFVDVSAPGSNIYSTYFNNTYTGSSGTSMAAPIAAGAAAIVKAQFPFYTGLQIGEQLRVTSDNIDGINPAYAGKLGRGRINLFRALSESAKSVRMENLFLTDNNDDTFVANDTLRISGDIINFLNPLSNLTVTLSTTSSAVTIIDNSTTPGAMGSLATSNNLADPFLVKINPSAVQNAKILFRLTFNDGAYTDIQQFELIVNVDYINVTKNDIGTTITSKGRLGYNNTGQSEGLGFTYKGSATMMYEGGLMIGANSNQVSDNVRGASNGQTDNDFQSVLKVATVIPTVKSEFDLFGKFNDALAGATTMNLLVDHQLYVWSTFADRKYVIVEYTIKNNGSSNISGLHAGIFSDWDIMDYNKNKISEDAATRMGYAWSTENNGLFAGIKLLTPGPFIHNAMDNLGGGSGGINIADGYSSAEKYQGLSTNRATAGGAGVGNDIIDVVSTGPYSISPGNSIVVAFALIGGDSLSDIISSAIAAQIKYDFVTGLSAASNDLSQNDLILYPVPAKNELNVVMNSAWSANDKVSILDALGQTVFSSDIKELNTEGQNLKISLTEMNAGIYILKVEGKNSAITKKFTIVR